MKSLPLLTVKSSKILIAVIIVLTGIITLILTNYNPGSNNKPENVNYTDDAIEALTEFQERFFEHVIIR